MASALPQRSVTLETSAGNVVIELYWQHAPRTCENFLQLSNKGYYANTIFHRVIADFMIQGGDPTGTGKGGVSIYGETFDDEINPELFHTGAGILSMANAYLNADDLLTCSGPNTNGSQFFISLAPTPWLDGKHTIFGRVFAGMGVIKRIGAVPTDASDRPKDPVVVYRATVNK